MESDDFSITQKESADGIKFILKGHMDYTKSEALQIQLEETIKNGNNKIILNMHQVDYLCSTGIRVILKIFKDTKNAGGSFGIEMLSERVRNVLGMVALDEMLIN